jgi:hypothetical protein
VYAASATAWSSSATLWSSSTWKHPARGNSRDLIDAELRASLNLELETICTTGVRNGRNGMVVLY